MQLNLSSIKLDPLRPERNYFQVYKGMISVIDPKSSYMLRVSVSEIFEDNTFDPNTAYYINIKRWQNAKMYKADRIERDGDLFRGFDYRGIEVGHFINDAKSDESEPRSFYVGDNKLTFPDPEAPYPTNDPVAVWCFDAELLHSLAKMAGESRVFLQFHNKHIFSVKFPGDSKLLKDATGLLCGVHGVRKDLPDFNGAYWFDARNIIPFKSVDNDLDEMRGEILASEELSDDAKNNLMTHLKSLNDRVTILKETESRLNSEINARRADCETAKEAIARYEEKCREYEARIAELEEKQRALTATANCLPAVSFSPGSRIGNLIDEIADRIQAVKAELEPVVEAYGEV